jgi:hypothetical protein
LSLDSLLLLFVVFLSILLAAGFLKLTQENPRLLGGIGNYRWDKYIEVLQPKRNYSLLEDPEEDEK